MREGVEVYEVTIVTIVTIVIGCFDQCGCKHQAVP